MSPRRALGLCLSISFVAALSGCATRAISEDYVPRALAWANDARLELQFQAPDTCTSVRLARHGDVASVTTAIAAGSLGSTPSSVTVYLRSVGEAAREIMVQEALDGPLASGRDAIACYEIEPPVRFGEDSPWEATALMVVEPHGEPAVLLRGPLGWSKVRVSSFEHSEPSVAKAIVAGGGVSFLLLFGLGADAVLGTLIGAGVVTLLWLMAGCPGLAWAVASSEHGHHH